MRKLNNLIQLYNFLFSMTAKFYFITILFLLIVSFLFLNNCSTTLSHENLPKGDSTVIVCGSSLQRYKYIPPETKIELVSFICLNAEKSLTEPQIVGGVDSLLAKIAYPEIAKRAGVEGTVTCEFVINSNGKVSRIKIIKGIGASCDENVMLAIKTQKFIPAQKEGKPTKQLVRAIFNFKLLSR